MSERFSGRRGCITSNGISILISDWVIFRGSRAPNLYDWRGRATIEEDALSVSDMLEGTFEMGNKTYHGNIEVDKMIPKTGEMFFTGKSELERLTENRS